MKSSRISPRMRGVLALLLVGSKGCAVMRHVAAGSLARPAALTGEWIDLRHTSAGDTALWVLRDDGYDGAARIVGDQRIDQRYGSWYLDGDITDGAGRAICFSKRIGRNGATCLSFSLDTVSENGAPRRRLIVHGYRGQHYTGDRQLLERSSSPNATRGE